MLKKVIIIFTLFFYYIFFSTEKTQAQTITPLNQLTITPYPNNISSDNSSFEALTNFMKVFFSVFDENKSNINQNNSNQYNQLTTPITTQIITPITTPITTYDTISPKIQVKPVISPNVNGLVYYPQCKGPYDNYPLPQGSTICKAGCGPTTVAMILASYIDKNINPKTVVNMYKEGNYTLGRYGSIYSDAQKILNKYQFKTHYILKRNKTIGGITIDEVMKNYGNQIKNFQNKGWTFFSLADFKMGGHYFWVLKFDDNLNIWAYDPAYDIPEPKPINHKSRYPFPKFRVIMALIKQN